MKPDCPNCQAGKCEHLVVDSQRFGGRFAKIIEGEADQPAVSKPTNLRLGETK